MQSPGIISCPIADCAVKRYRHGSRQRVFDHIRRNHDVSVIPTDFLIRNSLEPCQFCGKPYVTRSAYTGFNALEKHAKICPARNPSLLTSTSSGIGDSLISGVPNRPFHRAWH